MAPASAEDLRSKRVQSHRLNMIELFSLFCLTISPASCDTAERAFAQPLVADVTRVAPLSDVVESESFDSAISATGRVLTDDKAADFQAMSQRPELPRVLLDYQFPAMTGKTIEVKDGGNLQSALNKARRGDEIVLAAGATFRGNFVLPAKSGTAADGWIVVRSAQLSDLPALGTRVRATHANLMPKIVTPNQDPAIKTAAEASGWWLAGLEVTVPSSMTALQYGLIWLGDAEGGANATPSDLVLDRVYVHGQNANVMRCVALHAARAQVSDSYLSECHAKGYDSQAIWGGNGPGPFKIVNNFLQGAGENIMFGGSTPAIPGLVPSDIEIRRNYIQTPLSWKGVWTKKNLLELKNAARVLIEANVFEGSWTDAQTGWAMILRDDGCNWCFSRDVTVRRNLIRNAGAGINIANALRKGATRYYITENVLDSLATDGYTGDQRGFQLIDGVTTVTLERNLIAGGDLRSALLLEGGKPCVFKDNVWSSGEYGVIASGQSPGTKSLTHSCGASYVWSGMTMIGVSNGNAYPAGTTWVGSEGRAQRAADIRKVVLAAVAGVVDR